MAKLSVCVVPPSSAKAKRAHEAIVRLDMRTWSGNVGLMRLADSLGFKQEACFRKARIVKGQYFDGLGYGLLREEWEAQHPKGPTPDLR